MEFLKKLGIKKKNFGASTGVKWFGSETNEELKIFITSAAYPPERPKL